MDPNLSPLSVFPRVFTQRYLMREIQHRVFNGGTHGLFLEGVYKIELDTKTEYEGFKGTPSTFQNGYF
jgi:hypothetical protein